MSSQTSHKDMKMDMKIWTKYEGEKEVNINILLLPSRQNKTVDLNINIINI